MQIANIYSDDKIKKTKKKENENESCSYNLYKRHCHICKNIK